LKSVFSELIAITLFVASPALASAKQPDLSEKCVHALATVARSAAPGLTLSADRIYIGRTEVRLQAQIENEERADTKFLIGLYVDIYVNGVLQPLTSGSVGIGSDRDDAIETAVSEWAMSVGEALLGALGVRIGEEPQNIGSFLVYHGSAGIRGSHTVTWSTEKQRQLLQHLDTFIQGLDHNPGELHSISLLVSVRSDGTTGGECRVDGAISPALLKTVQSFPWGQNEVYLFKQFYVLRRRQTDTPDSAR
jgi:hypothetical protein